MSKKLILSVASLLIINVAGKSVIKASGHGHPQKRAKVEAVYENFSPQSSFKQNVYGLEAEYYMGSLANVGFTSNLSYYNYNTKVKDDQYYAEDLHAFKYSLLVRGEKVLFHGCLDYKSDELFDKAKDTEVIVMPAYQVYRSGSHMFYVGALYLSEKIYYRKIDGWNFLPIASYMYMSRNLQLILGFQNMLHWQINQYVSYDLDVDYELAGETSINFHVNDVFTISALARSNSESFRLAEREKDGDTLEKESYDAGLKLQAKVAMFNFWAYAGYSFQNKYYISNDKEDTEVMEREIDNGMIIRAGVQGRF